VFRSEVCVIALLLTPQAGPPTGLLPRGFELPANVDLEFAITTVFKVSGASVGLEMDDPLTKPVSERYNPFSLGGQRAGDAINQLLQLYPAFEARDLGRAIVVRPRDTWAGLAASPLDRVRLSIDLVNKDYDAAVLEISSQLCGGRVALPTRTRILSTPQPVSLRLSNVPAVVALSHFSDVTAGAWIAKPSNEETRWMLTFLAPGGVTTSIGCILRRP